MTRAKNIIAALALVVALIAIPIGLWFTTGNPIPSTISPSAITDALTRRDDGTIFVHLIAWIGWLAWAYFTISLVLETVSQLRVARHRPELHIPGFSLGRSAVAPLVTLILGASIVAGPAATAMAAPTQTPIAATSTTTAAAQRTAPVAPQQTTTNQPTHQANNPDQTRHTVRQDGEALWAIAEHYYGDGQQWTTIAQANPDLTGTNGRRLLQAGEVLVIPGVPSKAAAPAGFTAHTVTSSDTLSSLAAQHLGDADRWPEIFNASKTITQPDGGKLTDPNVILDGWTLHIPKAKATKAAPAQQQKPATQQDKKPAAQAQPKAPIQDTTPAGTGPVAPATRTPELPAVAHPSARPAQPSEQAPTVQSLPETSTTTQTDQDSSNLPHGIEALGGVVALCLLGVLGSRWRRQSARRRPGQRVPVPQGAEAATITALRQMEGPLTTVHLDRALRSLSVALSEQDRQLPPLLAVRLDDARIDFILAEDTAQPPAPFVATSARVWTWLPEQNPLPEVGAVAAPYPALVTLGRDADGAHLLVDLETLAALAITDDRPEEIIGVLAMELATSTWADDLTVTLVGACPELPAALGVDRLTWVPDMEHLIAQLEGEAQETRESLVAEDLDEARQGRAAAEPADAWTPHVVLVAEQIDQETGERLGRILADQPRVAIAAVTTDERPLSPWSLVSDSDGEHATLAPLGLTMTLQRLTAETYASICQVSMTSLSQETEPAPWWNHDEDAQRPVDEPELYASTEEESTQVLTVVDDDVAEAQHEAEVMPLHQPTIYLLGEVHVENVEKTLTNGRGASELMEPITYIHLHPGCLSADFQQALAAHTNDATALASRARRYLGANEAGDKLLPSSRRTDRGRVYDLHPSVTSDWAQLNALIAGGVNTAPTRNLWRALDLVTGRPLASVAPGQWTWVEGIRNDMIGTVLDIAHEVAERAIAAGDPNKAEWAINKGHMVDSLSEVIDRDELRLHRMTGNHSGCESVIERINANCRNIGLNPDPETVELIHSLNDSARHRARA